MNNLLGCCLFADVNYSNCKTPTILLMTTDLQSFNLDPQWTPWTSWTACSVTCNLGTKIRRRHCIDVAGGNRPLEPGVNFTIVLRVPFSCKRVFWNFSLLTVWLCNFLSKNLSAKAACKMLVQLTTGVNFSNIFGASFSYISVF